MLQILFRLIPLQLDLWNESRHKGDGQDNEKGRQENHMAQKREEKNFQLA
jgi:hypothetical protein